MCNLLYLVHRLPFPPNKGDKVRSFHLLKHLLAHHRVFLGTFLDEPEDEVYVELLREICPDLCVIRLNTRLSKLWSLTGLLMDQALSLRYYQNADLQAWVKLTLENHKIDAVVIFSSVMAQYVENIPDRMKPPMLVDFVDVDSVKWTQYSSNHSWPLSWLYRREGVQLLAYERSVAARAQCSFFITKNEADLFIKIAPECVDSVVTISNGVDIDFFSQDAGRRSPYIGQGFLEDMLPIVFTGAMDYWPNIDAVTWFAQDILPRLRQIWPQVCFYVVGRSPAQSVLTLASDSVVITGTVEDVRPYLQHASLVVAPLRIARGLQNKILEAMAMGKPVVASRSCAVAINAGSDELVYASDVDSFVHELDALLSSPTRMMRLGESARRRVVESYSWAAHLSGIDSYLMADQTTGVVV